MLVVNHALYCSHLASEGRVLPDHDVVIIDEAHAFPDNATNAFAGDVTTDALDALERHARPGRRRSPRRSRRWPKSAGAWRPSSRHARARWSFPRRRARQRADGGRRAAGGRERQAGDDGERVREAGRAPRHGSAGRRFAASRRRAPTTSSGSNATGGRSACAVAPVAAGETIGKFLPRATSGDRGVGDTRRRASVHRARDPDGTHANAQPGHVGRSRRRGHGGPPNAGRGYVALQTASSFDWRSQGILYVAKDLPDPSRARDEWADEAGCAHLRARQRVGRPRARAVHVARQRQAVRRGAPRTNRPRHPRTGRAGSAGRLIEAFVDDEASVLVGTPIVLGRHRRGRRGVRARRDRSHPVPGAGRALARGAAHTRRATRRRRVRGRRSPGRRTRPGPGCRPALAPTDRPGRRRRPRSPTRGPRRTARNCSPRCRHSAAASTLRTRAGCWRSSRRMRPRARAPAPIAPSAAADPRELRTDLSSAEAS